MKRIKSLLVSGTLTFPIMLILATEAKADLIVCNTSAYKAYVANAWYSESGWVSRGWTHVFPGECETILVGDMQHNSAYIYVSDDNWNPWNLAGTETSSFCLRQPPFEVVNADGVCPPDMIQEIFYRVISEQGYDSTIDLK